MFGFSQLINSTFGLRRSSMKFNASLNHLNCLKLPTIGNFFFLGGRGVGRLISLIIGNVEVAYGKITLAVATLGPLTAFSGSGIFLV